MNNPASLSKMAVTCFVLELLALGWLVLFARPYIYYQPWIGQLGLPDKMFNMIYFLVVIFCLLSLLIVPMGIVFGHIAADRIKKSSGALRGKWMARCAYIMGYCGLMYIVTFVKTLPLVVYVGDQLP